MLDHPLTRYGRAVAAAVLAASALITAANAVPARAAATPRDCAPAERPHQRPAPDPLALP
ncbi:hypothetical protein [Streptomyces sp. enrichment culture]|uniref:hypothetical protein n=1 Tax=Streptomyces sp. enrichment culture TaxID=1795815 RepID=UPI003F546275